MSTRIQVRRGTSAQWTAAQTALGATPIVLEGEIGFETDTGDFKIGDGVSLWDVLPYVYESFAFGPSFSDQVTFATSSATLAPIKLLSGVDKTSPVSGDLWNASNVLKYRTSTGVTKSIAYLDSTMTGVWNGTVVDGQYGGTGVANTGKTINLGGNLTTSGSFATTLTLTGATNVTLPTSGTLAINPTTLLGDTIYASAAGTPGTLSALAGPTTNGTYVLSSVPVASAAVAPAWLGASASSANSTVALRDATAGLTASKFNNLTLTESTTGYTITGGSITPKTLTVSNSYTLTGSDVTVSLAGNLTTSGAFATTLTATGTTAVTLPTTGTLATRAGVEQLTNKTYASNAYSTTQTLTVANDFVFLTSTGAYTVTLPAPTAGKMLHITRIDAAAGAFIITISGHINGTAATSNVTWFPASTNNRRVILISNGTSWYPMVAGTVV